LALLAANEPVLLDSDLALLYGVETRVFNQAIRRNQRRFPADFAFQLSEKEWSFLKITNCDVKTRKGATSKVRSLGLH